MTPVTPAAAATETVTAIAQDDYGTAPEAVLRLAETARPQAADDEIPVRARAASVDRGTWHLIAGPAYPMRPAGLRKPKAANPGRSLAGTAECAGTNVTGLKPGDDVYGTCDGESGAASCGCRASSSALHQQWRRQVSAPCRAAARRAFSFKLSVTDGDVVVEILTITQSRSGATGLVCCDSAYSPRGLRFSIQPSGAGPCR